MRIYKKEICGWGRYPVKECDIINIFYPLKNLNGLTNKFSHITPRGMGKSYGDASLSCKDGVVIDTSCMNKFISFDKEKGVIKALSGVSLSEILDLIIPEGWFLPVVPGTRAISLGGALASNVHGKNHHIDGAIANFTEEMEILTEGGLQVCTPLSNRELFFSTIGGMGMTGLIQSAKLRLKKIETSLINAKLIKTKNFEEALSIFAESDKKYEYSVTWVDCLAKGKNLGKGIVMLGNHVSAKDFQGEKNKLDNKWKREISLPDVFPNWTLNKYSINLFNFAYYNKMLGKEKNCIMNFDSWFFPLDIIKNWNVLYGKNGFIQYQFVMPFLNGKKGIEEALTFLSSKKIGSFLAVLKVVREDTVLLPFAVSGYTLALDIPIRNKEIFELFNELDKIVLKYGGRLYLTKDSRMSKDTFNEMYPRYKQWKETVNKFSPSNLFYSGLSERLAL